MTRALLALILCAAVACKDNSPKPASLAGTWKGSYTNIIDPDVVAEATLTLTQNGATITGTLTTSADIQATGARVATINATALSGGFNGTFTFTDQCGGSATTAADLLEHGQLLRGEYISIDCSSHSTGGYTLTKQ